ncbi:hypothetical protein QN277_023456 [Acacia crassicarpa]|uniref:SAUR family protein n=1 Tax=Acacia crassicarpa TaxID=499986 RepID=A0AAE1JLT9_9FABA|nr:hypothetical protein QN277_023456 [Acacia crassicarpa]
MAIVGKLTKLKSAIKRWPSLTKLSRSNSCVSAAPPPPPPDVAVAASSNNKDLHAVYVGRSCRRYLVHFDVVDHPLFQELVNKSTSSAHQDGVVVACQVVLFEHLLWMLETTETVLDSMDELVQFYNCSN